MEDYIYDEIDRFNKLVWECKWTDYDVSNMQYIFSEAEKSDINIVHMKRVFDYIFKVGLFYREVSQVFYDKPSPDKKVERIMLEIIRREVEKVL